MRADPRYWAWLFVVVFLASFWSMGARASWTAATVFKTYTAGCVSAGNAFTTGDVDASCQSAYDAGCAGAPASVPITVKIADPAGGGGCLYKGMMGTPPVLTNAWSFSGPLALSGLCGANATKVGSTCTCNAGYDQTTFAGGVQGCTAHNNCSGKTAGQSASSSGYFDMGTNPDKPGGGGGAGMTSCEGGCIAVFDGSFPEKTAMVNGVAHYFGEGSYKYVGSAASNQCTSADVGDPTSDTPADTCPTGQVVKVETQPNGSSRRSCVNPNTGEENNPNDRNNDGKPDSCQPGTFETTDGYTVTQSYNSGTGVCTQVAVKSGKPDINWSGSPNGPMPFQNPHPTNPGEPGGPGGPTVPNEDPADALCKRNPNATGCKASTVGGSCTTFTCSGDAAMCAIAQAAEKTRCAFENSKTVAEVLADSGLTANTKTAFLASVTSAPVDVSTLLQTNTRDLSGTCPAPISIATPWRSVNVSFSPLCDLANIIGVMVMLAATFVSVRLLAGGAG